MSYIQLEQSTQILNKFILPCIMLKKSVNMWSGWQAFPCAHIHIVLLFFRTLSLKGDLRSIISDWMNPSDCRRLDRPFNSFGSGNFDLRVATRVFSLGSLAVAILARQGDIGLGCVGEVQVADELKSLKTSVPDMKLLVPVEQYCFSSTSSGVPVPTHFVTIFGEKSTWSKSFVVDVDVDVDL